MIGAVIKKVFGTKQDRDLKLLYPLLNKINALEAKYIAMSDAELQAQTHHLKNKIAQNISKDEILCEAFATVREASKRILGMRHYDVQILGALVLNEGKIAEMKTGEGKTLTATMPLFFNALYGKGAHCVTVNDYLAKRDAHEMGVLYNWLGLSVGVILENLTDEERQVAYNSDITYGTNNEFAFDYLRDNMKFDLSQYVQRDHYYCIVDEVDSILIDEARTPLLISGPSEGDTSLYQVVNEVILKLNKADDYVVDEKNHTAILTDTGVVKVQKLLKIENLYDPTNLELLHHVIQSLKAHSLFHIDQEYVVRDGRVIIVDEFTGRLKDGSRWSDGLHQAVEAKENVRVKSENQTLASITFQNYFKLYSKLSGMTGTADTEAEEFNKIYNLDVVVIPTNLPMIREDAPDIIYASKDAKYRAVADLISECHKKGQPVLVGTISIESSEILSGYLRKLSIPHEILNAKQHEREADIIQKAGHEGSVTIATNMAGRGTDIKLTEVTKKVNGLFIIGTERHESRRIDNQLRGRSGRQGDPGKSKFFLSLEDDLMRIFGSDKIKSIMNTFGGMKDNEPIEHNLITNQIAKAQKRVEGHNFEIRKHLLDFDNVMNEQRKVIYKIRKDILNDEGNLELLHEMIEDVCVSIVNSHKPNKTNALSLWPWAEIKNSFLAEFMIDFDFNAGDCMSQFKGDPAEYLTSIAMDKLKEKLAQYEENQIKLALREILLSTFDAHWKDHLLAMDHLKEGINLRSYGQKDPLVEYKREAFLLYEDMKLRIKESAVNKIYSVRLYTEEEIAELQRQHEMELKAQLEAFQKAKSLNAASEQVAVASKGNDKVGRNDLCPCGSGKKYKHCHGA
jgi:preprotein translocase subunit SecA